MRNYRVTRRMVVGGLKGRPKPPNKWGVLIVILVIMFLISLITK